MSEEGVSDIFFREIEEPKGRIFAIGDIHGCVSELVTLLEFLVDNEKLSDEDWLIFIGDYVDRGPDSKTVLDTLISFRSDFPNNTIFLKGNHEDMFLNYLGFEGNLGQGYLINGGMSCLKSYGLDPKTKPKDILETFPQEHLDFLRSLDRYVLLSDFIFVHAGLNPLRDLRFQLDEDLFWIRDEFINNMHYFKKTIIFGHTPFEDVLFHLPYKIGIDTGLVYGNALSCIEITDEMLFQVGNGDREVSQFRFEDKGGDWPGM